MNWNFCIPRKAELALKFKVLPKQKWVHINTKKSKKKYISNMCISFDILVKRVTIPYVYLFRCLSSIIIIVARTIYYQYLGTRYCFGKSLIGKEMILSEYINIIKYSIKLIRFKCEIVFKKMFTP